jgi:hypothetical protein
MSLAGWLNWAWMKRCQRELSKFHRAASDVQNEQAQVLNEIIAANKDTAFGRQHRFDQIRTPRDFQSQIPLANYEDLQPWIDRAASGEPNVLTAEPIPLFEPTSGTTSAEKLIPYTSSLRRQFQRGIATWIADLFTHRPAARRGRAYWSISPAFGKPRRTSGGIPIGFEDDAAYLGGLDRLALRRILAIPPDVARLHDTPTMRRATLRHLLAAKDLSLISIWNPSFLTILLDEFNAHWEDLCADLRTGKSNGNEKLHVPCDRHRIDEIIAICRSTNVLSERLRQLWPNLALVSCWADAAAAQPYAELRQHLPHIEFQLKGLLATEGFISLPLCNRPAPALAIRSHFFEFLPVSATGEGDPTTPRFAHELESGRHYHVVITTGGGLYRYQLHDEIKVVGHWQSCPLLQFIGKTNQYSDLVGEKLAEPFVRQSIAEVCSRHKIEPQFSLVFPKTGHPPRYCLLLQARTTPEILSRIAAEMQDALERNPHYRYAVGINQLGRLEVAALNPSCNAQRLFIDQSAERGQKLGNIKPASLDRWTGWADVFTPHIQAVVIASDRNQQKPQSSPA